MGRQAPEALTDSAAEHAAGQQAYFSLLGDTTRDCRAVPRGFSWRAPAVRHAAQTMMRFKQLLQTIL